MTLSYLLVPFDFLLQVRGHGSFDESARHGGEVLADVGQQLEGVGWV